ncbi:MAG: alpha/beta fold hydrolase [Pleomorphochaeta sp.]
MKNIFLFLIILVISIPIFSRGTPEIEKEVNISNVSIDGYYETTLQITNSYSLPLTLEFKNNKGYFSSPSQNVFDIEVDYETTNNNQISITNKSLKFEIEGEIKENYIIGTFTQNYTSYEIKLIKTEKRLNIKTERKQTPTSLNYEIENLTIINKENNRQYFGTLTKPNNPENKNEIIIFISGSGIQDRNEEIFYHKPFFVISDYLTNNGYFTLRCDDYGFNGEDISHHTTLDIIDDIKSQINYIKNNYSFDKIILFGHSEGGIVAQAIANEVDSIILMAAPSISGSEIYKSQVMNLLINKKADRSTLDFFEKKIDEVTSSLSNDNLSIKEKEKIVLPYLILLGNTEDSAIDVFNILNSDWNVQFLKINPREYIKDIRVPTLILQGSKDTQVNFETNISEYKKYLNTKYKINLYQDYNHLLQKCETGEIYEYNTIDITIEENVLSDILLFLNKL